jgi:hypothetical protein
MPVSREMAMSARLWWLSAVKAADLSSRPILSSNRKRKKEPKESQMNMMPVISGRLISAGWLVTAFHRIVEAALYSTREIKRKTLSSVLMA